MVPWSSSMFGVEVTRVLLEGILFVASALAFCYDNSQ